MIETLLAGGLTGIVGGFLEKAAGFGLRWMELKEKREDRAHEITLQKMQAEARRSETESEERIAQYQADSANLQASYQHDISAGQGSQWVIDTLRLIRPIITLSLITLTAFIYFSLNPEDMGLREQIISTVLYAASSAVLWWFASRVKSR